MDKVKKFHFGLAIEELGKSKLKCSINESKHFIPASTLKFLSVYSSFKNFDTEKLPAFVYKTHRHNITIKPIGDLTLLNPNFKNQPFYDFLQSFDTIFVNWNHNSISKWGVGWAWEDALFDFQASKSWSSIYGNLIICSLVNDKIRVTPSFFSSQISYNSSTNKLTYKKHPHLSLKLKKEETIKIPFDITKELFCQLLSDTLKKPVIPSSQTIKDSLIFYGLPIDTVLTHMMKNSDNFLAEQLLILSAWNSRIPTDEYINHFKKENLAFLTDLRWVDGSGLSRYNLISPLNEVKLLKQVIHELGVDKMLGFLSVGGVDGTLKNQFKNSSPYVFAKSGSLSNNYSLLGLLKSKKGKWYIFSFMVNNYLESRGEILNRVENILYNFYEKY